MSGAHKPFLSAAGHFMSMQPVTDPLEALDKVWYSGTEFAAMHSLATKYMMALESVVAAFNEGAATDDWLLLKMAGIAEDALK